MVSTSDPLISVLMPAYNAEKYIEQAIESIINQTYTNWELLICDDGSTDNTYKYAKKYTDDPRVKVFKNKQNKKKPTTTNELFANSRGELITIHDADDLSNYKRFEKIVERLKNDPKIYACGHEIQRITEKGKPLDLYRIKSSNFLDIKESMKIENTDGDPSLFIKREVIQKLGQIYRPYFSNNMDYDFALRIIENYETTNIKEVLSYYRNVENSISKGITNYKKLITQDVTKFLADQRKEFGSDAIQNENWALIKRKEAEFSKPYLEDKTLYLRKMAAFFMYVKMNKSAVQYMITAVKKEPLKFENWRTLQYCLRKSLIKI